MGEPAATAGMSRRAKPIHLVGAAFSRQTRNITAFDTSDA